MSARRGEVPFVAVPVGYSNNVPETRRLARLLKCSRATALGYLIMWHELFLTEGDAKKGTLTGFTAEDIAEQLDFPGSRPRKLLDSLRAIGVAGTHRKTIKFPGWLNTITGEYAARKVEDREWERERKAAYRAARQAQLEALMMGRPSDVPGTNVGRPTLVPWEGGQKERNESPGQPPQPPATRGESKGASRWRWVFDHHHSPVNPEGCARILEGVDDELWPMVQWLLDGHGPPPPRSSSRKFRLLQGTSYQILAKGAYLKFRPEWQEKLRQDARPKNGTHKAPAIAVVDEAAERSAALAQAVTFVMAELADPDASEAQKEKARGKFRRAWPDVPPPWEAPSA